MDQPAVTSTLLLTALVNDLLADSLLQDGGKDEGVNEEEEQEKSNNDDEKEAKLLDELVEEVAKVGITYLVEALGPYLTSEEPIPRVRATAVLCEVIRKMGDTNPSVPLGAPQIKTLLSFFISRYETDWESALACLRGMLALLKSKSLLEAKSEIFSDEFARDFLKRILVSHTVNELVQTLRSLVFEIVRLVLGDYSEFVKQTESDPWLTSTFSAAMAGEKDPRCLIICLEILEKVLRNPRLGGQAYVEDAFELTSVYFPITFQPPPDDPFGITHEKLVDSLNAVFCAIPAMANCILPMAFERIKMTSTEAGPARIEALRLVSRAAHDFDTLTLAPFLSEIRDTVVGLVLSPDEEELAAEALTTLKVIVRQLAPRALVNPQDPLWDEFTLTTLRRCGMALEASIDSMAANGAAAIIVAVSESCEIGFATSLKGLLPLLEALLLKNAELESPSKNIATMDLIRSIARCVDPTIGHLPGAGAIDPFAPSLLQMAESQLARVVQSDEDWINNADLCRLVVNSCLALKDIICRPVHLNIDSQHVQNELCDLLLRKVWIPVIKSKARNSRKDVLGACLVCLRDLDAKCKGAKILSNKVVVALLNEAAITAESEHFDILGGEMKEKLEAIISQLPLLCQTEDETIASAIVSFLSRRSESGSSLIPEQMTTPVLPRIARCIPKVEVMERCFLESPEQLNVWMDMPDRSQLLSTLCERCSPRMNEHLVRLSAQQLEKARIVGPGAEACLMAMRRDYTFVLPACLQLLNEQSELAEDERFLRVLAGAFNKAPSGSVLDDNIQLMFASADKFSAKTSAKVFGRVFKALALRSSNQAADRMGKFLQSLLHAEDVEVSMEASRGFGNLLQTSNDGLSSPFVRAQGVARQRAFEKWFKLLQDDLSSTEASSDAVLNACAALAAGAQHSVLNDCLKDVIQTMVKASRSNIDETRLSALRILKNVMEKEAETVGIHLSTLIPFLLKFTTGPTKAAHANDRLDALIVLESLPTHLVYHKLHPFRPVVSSALAKGALDDPKRVVRQKAVECREKWALFSAN